MVGVLMRSKPSHGTQHSTANLFASGGSGAAVDRMIAYIAYAPRLSDEAQLAIGDTVVVLHRYDDNWCLAKNESTGATGVVPGNFLHNINNPFLPDTMTAKNTRPPTRKVSLALKDKVSAANGPSRTSDVAYSAPQPANAAAAARIPQQHGFDKENSFSSSSSKHQTLAPGRNQQQGLFGSEQEQELSLVNPRDYAVEIANGSKVIFGGSGQRPSAKGQQYAEVEFVEGIVGKWASTQRVHRERCRTPHNLGFVKLAIVGDSGIGKTALTRALMEMDEIVKSDSDYLLFESEYYEGGNPANYGIRMNDVLAGPKELVEIHGCTMDTRKAVNSNGKTLMVEPSETPMPMNLTVIDTPGYSSDLDALTVLRPLIAYQAREFERTNAVFLNDVPSQYLRGFLAGPNGAHGHIDAILYCILHRITAVDIELMRRLSKVACIIPVLMKCDTLSKKEVVNLRINVLKTLCKENIPFYGMGLTREEISGLVDFASSLPLTSKDARLNNKQSQADDDTGLLSTVRSAEDLFNQVNFPFVISNKPPASSPVSNDGVSAINGAQDDYNEGIEELRQAVLYDHIDSIRHCTADGFAKWRDAVSASTK